MGRCYYGDIEGKFWVAIQSSDDVENLVSVEPYNFYSWKVCDCRAEIDDYDYCTDCYESIDDHIEQAIEEDEYEDKCLYYEEGYNGYSIDKDIHYNELMDSMTRLKSNLPNKIIEEFDKIEQTDQILNAFSGVFNDSLKVLDIITFNNEDEKVSQLRLLARYTLGYQIEYCLRTTGSCNIQCEF
jgi:hypothetical protein